MESGDIEMVIFEVEHTFREKTGRSHRNKMIITTQPKPTLKPNLTIACFNPPPTNWQNSRNFLVLYSPLCSTIVPYVLKWSCTVPYGPVEALWYCMFWYVYELSHMVVYVPLWSPMVLYGLWNVKLPYCSIKPCKISNSRRYWNLRVLVRWREGFILS